MIEVQRLSGARGPPAHLGPAHDEHVHALERLGQFLAVGFGARSSTSTPSAAHFVEAVFREPIGRPELAFGGGPFYHAFYGIG